MLTFTAEAQGSRRKFFFDPNRETAIGSKMLHSKMELGRIFSDVKTGGFLSVGISRQTKIISQRFLRLCGWGFLFQIWARSES